MNQKEIEKNILENKSELRKCRFSKKFNPKDGSKIKHLKKKISALFNQLKNDNN